MKIIIISTLIIQILAHKVRYDDYRVYRVTPRTHHDLSLLQTLEKDATFSFWTGIKTINHPVDVMVPPGHISNFEKFLNVNSLQASVNIHNVQELIDKERPESKVAEFGWTDYYTLDEINGWLVSLVEKYPDQVSLVIGGTSYQYRSIFGVHVSFSPENSNKTVFVESNIHACEWIGSAVSTYILNQFLTSSDPAVRQVADSHDWYFFPVFNPDGFAYTHNADRLWRKTRVPYGNCTGADPNRNWGYHYNDGGSSDDPCSETYRGPEAFSEPLTRSLSDFISTIGDSLVGYIAFHSYSQVLLLPYGYTTDHLDNYDELYQVGLKANEALSQRYGTQYKIGDVAEVLYVASGGSFDWVKGTFGTRIAYTYELRDTGEFGMLLPAEQILPTAEETLDSFLTIFQEFDQLDG